MLATQGVPSLQGLEVHSGRMLPPLAHPSKCLLCVMGSTGPRDVALPPGFPAHGAGGRGDVRTRKV